jgi:hypothetical protein
MNESNLDINLIVQSFQERIGLLITEVVVKEATIKQLTMQLQQKQEQSDGFDMPLETVKRAK